MFKIGTRGSHLATTQSGHVRDALGEVGHPAELQIVTTSGDLSQAPVERIGVGVFTSALRDALFTGEVWTGRKAVDLGLADGVGTLRGVLDERGEELRVVVLALEAGPGGGDDRLDEPVVADALDDVEVAAG